MLIETRTDHQLELWKKIIQELIKRPQMPIEILAGIIWESQDETYKLVNDLEYRWSIEWRVSKNFLIEAECTNIKLIQDELERRLWKEAIQKLHITDLEKFLEAALIRKWKLEWEIDMDFSSNTWDHVYIDKLLQYNNTSDEKKQIDSKESSQPDEGSKKKVVKTVPKKS